MRDHNLEKSIEQDDRWDNRELGASEEYAERVERDEDIEEKLNESNHLRTIHLRLEHELICELERIANYHGLGYQTMTRQLLKRFVNCETNVLEIRSKAMRLQGPKMAGF